MNSLQARAPSLPLRPAERRRHFRVDVKLLGRYMLANRLEYPCETINMSPGGALLVAPVRGGVGERVIAYLEHVGRVEGLIARHTDRGFAVRLSGTARKQDKIASQLTWLANRQSLGLPEDRRHERIVPRSPAVVVRFENGRTLDAYLIDVSLSGAAVATDEKVPIGTGITLGQTPGTVVRQFQGGIAVEFRLPISPDRFGETIIL